MNFKVGDTVRFKTGGPDMIINHVNPTLRKYTCRWFYNSQLNAFTFDENELYTMDEHNILIIEITKK